MRSTSPDDKEVTKSTQLDMVLHALLSALGETSVETSHKYSSISFGHDEIHTVLDALVGILGADKIDYTVSDKMIC